MAARAAYFSPSEAEILMEAYEEVKDVIKKKGNTATVIKQREKAWQSIADRLNVKVVHKYSLTAPPKHHNYNPSSQLTSPKT